MKPEEAQKIRDHQAITDVQILRTNIRIAELEQEVKELRAAVFGTEAGKVREEFRRANV